MGSPLPRKCRAEARRRQVPQAMYDRCKRYHHDLKQLIDLNTIGIAIPMTHTNTVAAYRSFLGLVPQARIQSSSVRIRTSLKPARFRYVSISCGVEFCVICGGRFSGENARWVSNTFQ